MDHVSKLKKLAQRWGGSVEELSEDAFDDALDENRISEAPFGSRFRLGVDFAGKRVVYTSRSLHPATPAPDWHELLHEMGHVFATLDAPNDCNEYDFLGWEYAVAKMLRSTKEWREGMRDYSVGEGDDFGTLSKKDQDYIIRERLDHAEYLNLVVNGKPVAIR